MIRKSRLNKKYRKLKDNKTKTYKRTELVMLLLKTKRTCMSSAETHDWSLALGANVVAQIILHVSVPYSIIYLRLAMRLDLLGTDRASLMEEQLTIAYGELLPVVLIEEELFT